MRLNEKLCINWLNYHSTRSPPHASPPSGRSDEGTKTWESVWRKKEMNEGRAVAQKLLVLNRIIVHDAVRNSTSIMQSMFHNIRNN